MATGVAVRLYCSGFRRLMLLEQPEPLAVRRTVCLCEAVYDERVTVEGVTAQRITAAAEREAAWAGGNIPLLVDATAACLGEVQPHVLIEVTLAKRNVGVTLGDAPLVIGVGPGFTVGRDVHRVIESNRGPNLGRVFREGSAEPNTGIPGTVKGLSVERVLRAPATGVFTTDLGIGSRVEQGKPVGFVNGTPALARISGIVRGLLRPNIFIDEGVKIGDIEPREGIDCFRISEKALAIGGGVLEAILERYNS